MIATFRDSLPRAWAQIGQVFSGMFLRNILRGLFKLLLAGFLSPAAMGVLRATQSLWRILGTVTDLGLNYTVTVLVPPAIRSGDDDERDRTLMTAFGLAMGSILLLLVVGLLLASQLAATALGDPALVGYARLAVLAVGGRMIWKFAQSNLAARQQFGRLGIYLSTAPFLMIGVGGALALLNRLTLNAAVAITLLAPAVTVLVWWPWLDNSFLRLRNWDGALARRILKFSRWIYLSSIGSSLRNHLNPLLLKSPTLSGSIEAGAASAGLYGFGNDLANELQMLSGSVATVLMPKASRLTRRSELRSYFVRAYRWILLLVLALAPLSLLAEPGLRLLGKVRAGYLEYLPSIPIFMILYFGGLFAVAMIPASTTLYALRMPQIETRIEFLMLIVLIVLGIALIPLYGAIGAAITVMVQRVLALLLTFGYAVFQLWFQGDDAVEDV